jgi:NADPH2:quinone reductase
VVATASGANEEFVRGLGAAEFVDYRTQAFEECVEPVDLVIDGIGGSVQERSLLALKDGGMLVSPPGDVPGSVRRAAADRGIAVRYFSVRPNGAALLKIRDLIELGLLWPTVSTIRPLADAREAHEEAQAGHVRGKLVLDTTATHTC